MVRSVLTDIFVGKFVAQPDSLRLVFDGAAVHDSMFELFHDRFVNLITLQDVSIIVY